MVRPPIFDRDVLTLDIAGLFQGLTKAAQAIADRLGRSVVEESDHWHRRLLRARRERPCRRAPKRRDERAAIHSITSSARASSIGGTTRPMALAAVTLMTRSNLVGCSTGMSPGFAPRRILST